MVSSELLFSSLYNKLVSLLFVSACSNAYTSETNCHKIIINNDSLFNNTKQQLHTPSCHGKNEG